MLELADAQIGAWVSSFLLPMFRITALLMTMPVIGTELVTGKIRLFLALVITLLLVPNLPPMPVLDSISLASFVLIAQEILTGAMLGFCLQLFFHIFVVGGQILAIQIGLGFASMIDPTSGVSVPVVSQYFTMLVTLLFLATNGHLVVFEVVAESFVTLPVGSGLQPNQYWELATMLGWSLAAGLLLVLPAVTALLVVSVTFGVMSRAAPQLNIFSIGFPLTLVLGLVILWISLGDVFAHYQVLSSEALLKLRELVRAR